MSAKRLYKRYPDAFKEEAVSLVTEQGYSVADAAQSLGIRPNHLYDWKAKQASMGSSSLTGDERRELVELRKQNKQLRMERDVLKKGQRLFRERNEVQYRFIKHQSALLPVSTLCQVMQVGRSSYYAWRRRPAKPITADELHLYRRTKALFAASRNSLGNREMMKKLREEDFDVGCYRTRTVMRRLGLKVQQRVAYKVAT